jgi:16S rRNA (guanine527-N7)-methyltransferase
MDKTRMSAGGDGPGAQPGPSSPSGRYAHSDAPVGAETASAPHTAENPSPGSARADSRAAVGSAAVGRSAPAAIGLPDELTAPAKAVFGDRLPLAVAYAELLTTDGVVRGLIGPREAPRLWDRHLLNCAVVAEMIPHGASVLDVGSGAGLPGIVLAVARPDVTVTLVEPLARRTAFLTEAVDSLGLGATVTVVRARAEEAARDGIKADVVTARAVAPLDRLAGWCLPLTIVGGRLLALKGSSAADEIAEHRAAVQALGGGEPSVHQCGAGIIDPPTTVVEVVREREVTPVRAAKSGRRSPSGSKTARGRSRRR